MAEWKHGMSAYANHGCRCAICRQANTEKMRAYRNRITSPRQKLAQLKIRRAYLTARLKWLDRQIAELQHEIAVVERIIERYSSAVIQKRA
jgi:septal ring factor EnvC (AmiA/AmiB activator)